MFLIRDAKWYYFIRKMQCSQYEGCTRVEKDWFKGRKCSQNEQQMSIERKDQIGDIGHVESKRFCDQLDLGVKADITPVSGLES